MGFSQFLLQKRLLCIDSVNGGSWTKNKQKEKKKKICCHAIKIIVGRSKRPATKNTTIFFQHHNKRSAHISYFGRAVARHTGNFVPNSFQIDSINSCRTSKKLLFWVKIVKIIYSSILKPIKGKLGLILIYNSNIYIMGQV